MCILVLPKFRGRESCTQLLPPSIFFLLHIFSFFCVSIKLWKNRKLVVADVVDPRVGSQKSVVH